MADRAEKALRALHAAVDAAVRERHHCSLAQHAAAIRGSDGWTADPVRDAIVVGLDNAIRLLDGSGDA